jgi:uncharacterized protein involved in high-affinity Fe2+ transport
MANMLKNYPGAVSDEAEKDQLKLAKQQGKAYQKTLKEMTENEAADGGTKEADDYLVGYAVEEAEGMYEWNSEGDLVWRNPDKENAHVEITVMDKLDGRFIPSLEVTASLTSSDGQEIGPHEQPFLWHSWLYHYGRNWVVPASGSYSLQVTIQPPKFLRHDKANGNRYQKPVTVTFDDVHIATGQKIS